MGLFDNKQKNTKKESTNKTEQNVSKQSVKGRSKSVQDILDFEEIKANGIIVSKLSTTAKYYSKLYKLIDSNFITEPDEKQWEILSNYTKFVNRFPENVDINIIIVNKRNTMSDLIRNFHIHEQGDTFDKYRQEYNSIIDVKINDGRNDITKDKYIMLTAKEKSYDDAESTFNTCDLTLNDAIKAINKHGVKKVTDIERLDLIRTILNGATDVMPFEKEFARYITVETDNDDNTTKRLNYSALKKAGVSVKDLVAPQCIARDKQALMLNNHRIAKSFCYASLPQSLDTSFLTKTTNLPFEMVTVVQLKTVPRKKAITMVKNQNTAIKADVIKASKVAYQNGYSPELMNEDLQQAQEGAKNLRNDILNKGKKLFFATISVTIFGEKEEELKDIEQQFTSICNDFTVTPSYLIGQQIEALNAACLLTHNKITIDRAVTSDDVCALFPFNIQELQDKKGHFYGINSMSKNMIMYDRKRSKLANGLIFGQSGSGKSFLTKGEIIPNILDGNDDMIILDPENEYRVIAEKFGGVIIDLELKSQYTINPCDMSMEWEDPKATPLAEKCDYMVGLVESILGKGRECNSFEVNAIHKATSAMYEPYIDEMTRRKEDGVMEDIDTEICPTLVDFYDNLVALRTPEALKIANSIEPYCTGQYNVFAHKTNVPTGNRLTVYNLLALPEKMKEMAMKVCLSNIWTRVIKNREENDKFGTGKSIWVYLDEFHLFFQTEASATTIMAYFKRVRKYGGIMTGITQDVADLLRTQQGTAMFNNTGFFIFLNQSPIGRSQLQNLYGISDALIDCIKDKPSGQGLLYNGTNLIPFDYRLPNDNELYKIMSTNPNDKRRRPMTEDEYKTAYKQEMEQLSKINNAV